MSCLLMSLAFVDIRIFLYVCVFVVFPPAIQSLSCGGVLDYIAMKKRAMWLKDITMSDKQTEVWLGEAIFGIYVLRFFCRWFLLALAVVRLVCLQ